MLVVLNRRAHGGRAAERWERVAPFLRTAASFDVVDGDGDIAPVRQRIRRALQAGETRFVAAGGDGTVNLLATALAQDAPERLEDLTLGGIGLGSSNDFHKPHPATAEIDGVPTRLDFAHAERRDVCGAQTWTEDGASRTLYWIVNASVGITAEANWTFNHPGRWLALLKRTSSDTAIVWAALRTILRCPALEARVSVDGAPAAPVRLKNLGIVKNPHFAGSLCYDSPFEPDSGLMHAHLVGDLPVPRLLRVFAALARGRFAGSPGTTSWRAHRLELESDRTFAVECDGEVVRARRATFFVLPQRLRVCLP